jgi:hypothetical protein
LARRPKQRPTKKEKYHAAGSPERACPELVEGSKGRPKLLWVSALERSTYYESSRRADYED